jgi:hypothetical protein
LGLDIKINQELGTFSVNLNMEGPNTNKVVLQVLKELYEGN